MFHYHPYVKQLASRMMSITYFTYQTNCCDLTLINLIISQVCWSCCCCNCLPPFLLFDPLWSLLWCNCQQWSPLCPSFLQCFQEIFSSFTITEFAFFPFPFLLSSFLEDVSPDTPTLVFPASMYVA